jgi:3-dehydroquinate dehydratase-1
MICVSLLESDIESLLTALQDLSFAEVRLEQLQPTPEDVARIFSQSAQLVATIRPGTLSDEERADILIAAIGAGAAYVDVEIESPDWFKEKVVEASRKAGCQVIVSYHDYDRTPPPAELRAIVDRCFDDGADIAKVACQADSQADSARLLGLLDRDSPVIALGMGPAGRITRVAGPLLGAPFTFASRQAGSETAPGQIDAARLKSILALISS